MEKRRIEWLDGVRGMAAMSVAFAHLLASQSSGWPRDVLAFTEIPVINIPWNGSAAVSIFFVLSGYVLTLGMHNREKIDWHWLEGYLIGRIIRIAFPFWGALLLSLALYSLLYDAPYWMASQGNWLAKQWGDGSVLAEHPLQQAILILPHTEHTIIPPGWTLTVELQISLLLPMILLISVRSPLLGPCAVLVAGVLLHQTFVVHFLLGMFLVIYQKNVDKFLEKRSSAETWLLFLLGVILLSMLWHPAGKMDEILRWCINGAGAAIVIALGHRLRHIRVFFESRPLIFLGHISYSLYLLHFTLYLILLPYLSDMLQTPRLITAILAAIALATIFHHVVERPSIGIGHRIKKFIGSRS